MPNREVDTTIFGNPITVDGYIVLYNETAYEDSMQCYYFLGYTNGSANTTYTHYYVTQFRDQMFYKVVAFKDYRGNINDILVNLPKSYNRMNSTNTKLTWSELQRRFK